MSDVADLIARAREGSETAVGELLATFRTYLLHVANREGTAQIRAKVAASDIVQDACLLAHRRFDTFRGTTEAELRGWMRSVLLNCLSDSRKKFLQTKRRNPTREVSFVSDDHVASIELTPGSSAIAREEAKLVSEALDRLSPEHREVLTLRSFDLLSFAEIGERMNRSQDASQKLWNRALQKLKQQMNP